MSDEHDIELLVARLVAKLERDLDLLKWIIGLNLALTAVIFVRVLFR